MKLLTKTGWILLLCILSFSSSFAYSQDSTVINESGSWIDNNRFNTGPTEINNFDNPIFKLEVPRVGEVTVSLESAKDSLLYLLDEDFNLITQDDNSGTGNNALISRQLQAGTYFFVAARQLGEIIDGEVNIIGDFNINLRSDDFTQGELTLVKSDTQKISSSWNTNYGSSGPNITDVGNPVFQLEVAEPSDINIGIYSGSLEKLFLANQSFEIIKEIALTSGSDDPVINTRLDTGTYYIVAGSVNEAQGGSFNISTRTISTSANSVILSRLKNSGLVTIIGDATLNLGENNVNQYDVLATGTFRLSLDGEGVDDDCLDLDVDPAYSYRTSSNSEERKDFTVFSRCEYNLRFELESDAYDGEGGNGNGNNTAFGSFYVVVDHNGDVTITRDDQVDANNDVSPPTISIDEGISNDRGRVKFNVLQLIKGEEKQIAVADKNSVKFNFTNDGNSSLTDTYNASDLTIGGVEGIYINKSLPLVNTQYNFTVTYTIDGLVYQSEDSFTFRDGITDKQYELPQIIIINQAPQVTTSTLTTKFNTAKTVVFSATDSDGDDLTFNIVSQPVNGQVTNSSDGTTGNDVNWVFTPATNFAGTTSFTFTANDDYVVSTEVATISVIVEPNTPPTVTAQDVSLDEDSDINITLVGTDNDGQNLKFSIASQPLNGAVVLVPGSDNNYVFTPNANFNGTTFFTFTANDGIVDSTAARIDITVDPVNDAPTISGQPATTIGDGSNYQFTPTAIDVDGDKLAFRITNTPSWATFNPVTGALTGTPARSDAGTTSSIVISVTDSALTASLPAFNVEVLIDAVAPVVIAPANITLATLNASGLPITDATVTSFLDQVSAVDDVDGAITTISNDISGTSLPLGETLVTFSATDSSGNTGTASATITVTDQMAPVIAESPVLTIEATGPETSVTLTAPEVTDNVDSDLTATASSTGPFTVGTTTITWTATDTAGNTVTNTQNVIVTDTTKPSFAPLADIAIFAVTGNGAVDFSAATATDTVDGTITATTTFVKGDYAAGTYAITWTATDTAGNSATATQNVIVSNDETKPVFDVNALADITEEATAKLTPVALPSVTATDDGNTLQATASNNGPFAVGTTIIIWTATDTAGNTETNTQNVIVTDTTKPTFDALADVEIFTATDDGAVDFPDATATDLVDGTITARTTFVKGDRAAGTYVITWTATDIAGNSATATQNVIVSKDETKPVFDVTVLADIIQEATATLTAVNLPTVTATDDGNTLQATTSNTGPFAVGTTTITWTAADSAGNTETNTQKVIVTDTTKPSFATLADVIIFAATGNGAVDFTAATATDIVDGTITATTDFVKGDYATGTYAITWTATDSASNSATAIQNVIVSNDETNPVFDTSALADIIFEATAELTLVALPSVTATDDGETLQAVANIIGPFALGDTTITWTASDATGNTASLTQVIRIVDTTAPVFAEIGRIEIDAEGRLTDISSLLNITAVDLVDGDIDSVISGETVFESGVHQVEVTATDNSDLIATIVVEVAISPRVQLSEGVNVFAGATAKVDVVLTGVAVTYPVLVDYTINDGEEERLEIASGQSATIEFMVDDNALEGTQFEVTLTGAQNAVIDDGATSLVSIVAVNVAPIATINVLQQGVTTGIVALDAGDITLTAQVSDVGPTTNYAYRWEETTLGNLGSDASVTLSAEQLSAGPVSITLTVEELDTDDLFSVIVSKYAVVKDTLTLTSETDSDGDGMTDAMEGAGDSDDDGIADYLDTDPTDNVLPIDNGTSVIIAPVGVKLSLGSVAIEAGNGQAASVQIASTELATDNQFEPVGDIINFKATGLAKAGDAVTVIVQLADGVSVPSDAVYRKFSVENGWSTFTADGNNQIASGSIDVNGNCPTFSSDQYQAGLVQGTHCIALTIQDGGIYDADGQTNGSVEDPGVLSVLTINDAPTLDLVANVSASEQTDVSVTATAIDPEAEALSYTWLQTSGTAVTIDDPSSATLAFTAPDITANEELTFELTVSDGVNVVTDSVVITITFVNNSPTVTASVSPSSALEQTSVTFTASADDSDGQTLSYSWSQVSGPDLSLTDTTSASFAVTLPAVTSNDSAVLRVTVSDGIDTVSADVTVTIQNQGTVTPPSTDSGGGGSFAYMTLLLLSICMSRVLILRRYIKKS
jgi:hypothetical protein